MRTILLLFVLTLFNTLSYAQQKVDLSKAPIGNNGLSNTKSNAAILRDATPQSADNKEVDLAEKYKSDNTTVQGTFRTVKQNEPRPNMMNSGTEVLNGSTHQMNIGTGTKANSTTYYDNEGRIRGTNTTISFGK
ncbi:MAG: hypothetical protein R2800_01195 [Flavipsychrobacter sp.]